MIKEIKIDIQYSDRLNRKRKRTITLQEGKMGSIMYGLKYNRLEMAEKISKMLKLRRVKILKYVAVNYSLTERVINFLKRVLNK